MLHCDQPRLREPFERLAHRAAIHAQRLAQGALGGEGLAGPHRAADDLVAELVEDRVGEGLPRTGFSTMATPLPHR